jgi:pimeloyl-ACP methyl ester carboxylesterase
MQDYGGPVGFRMALAHPERIEALIVQDAVAHNEGLGTNWKPRRAFWADRESLESTLRTNLLSPPTPVISPWTRLQMRSRRLSEALSVLPIEGS